MCLIAAVGERDSARQPGRCEETLAAPQGRLVVASGIQVSATRGKPRNVRIGVVRTTRRPRSSSCVPAAALAAFSAKDASPQRRVIGPPKVNEFRVLSVITNGRFIERGCPRLSRAIDRETCGEGARSVNDALVTFS